MKKRIILLCFGIAITTTSVTSVISCSESNASQPNQNKMNEITNKQVFTAKISKKGLNSVTRKMRIYGFQAQKDIDQKKLNEITKIMISNILINKLNPLSHAIPNIPPKFYSYIHLNGLDNLNIIISNWFVNSTTQVTMSASVSRQGLITPPEFTKIIISNFITHDQEILNGIPKLNIELAIQRNTKFTPDGLPVMPNPFSSYYSWYLGGLNDVITTISDWHLINPGLASMNVVLSKTGLISPSPYQLIIKFYTPPPL